MSVSIYFKAGWEKELRSLKYNWHLTFHTWRTNRLIYKSKKPVYASLPFALPSQPKRLPKSLQSCPTLCNPVDCSPPGSSVQGIFQTRILEWVAMPSFRESSWPRNQTRFSYPHLLPALASRFFATRATWEAKRLCLRPYKGVLYCDLVVLCRAQHWLKWTFLFLWWPPPPKKNITKPNFVELNRSLFLISGFQIFSVTNNTECGKLLEEIKCAVCSPHSQSLFYSPEREALERDLVLPLLCKDYCKEFFYTCRGHIPGKKKKMMKWNQLLQNSFPR